YLTHALRRPAFFVTHSNRRAEALAETLRFFSGVFPGATGGVATLPAFDRLPWESQSPHADILERRAATLFRVADGQISLVIAPIAAALWRYQDPAAYLYLTRTLAKDTEIPHEELITHLGSVGYTRTEMQELPWHFAVRCGRLCSSMSRRFCVTLRRNISRLRRKITSVTVAPTPPPPPTTSGPKGNLRRRWEKLRKFTLNNSRWKSVPRRSLNFPRGRARVFTGISLPAWET